MSKATVDSPEVIASALPLLVVVKIARCNPCFLVVADHRCGGFISAMAYSPSAR